MMDDHLRGQHTTFITATVTVQATPDVAPTPFLPLPGGDLIEAKIKTLIYSQSDNFHPVNQEITIQRNDSTINGVVIGLLSSFGSAILIALIFLIIYFFRYTSSGRILLDRIGRPGEYDDEQQYLREEAEALEEMDDLQRTEYLRAKGMVFLVLLVRGDEWLMRHVI